MIALFVGPILRRIEDGIEYLITRVHFIQREQAKMAQELENLKSKVETMNSVMDSAAALLKGLADEIRKSRDNPGELQALADQIDRETQELAEAITANTPAEEGEGGETEPLPEPEPAPPEGEPQPSPAQRRR